MSTVKKVLDVHADTLAKVIDYSEYGIDSIIRTGVDLDDDDLDEELNLRPQIKASDIVNMGGFKKGLQHDVKQLNNIYTSLQTFEIQYRAKQERDLKLDELVAILRRKAESANKKVIIFTAYSDTAKFIYDELVERGFTRIASASGVEVCSTGSHSKKDFTEVLQSFAPYSKLYKEMDWSYMYDMAKLDRSSYYNDDKQRWEVPYELWASLLPIYKPEAARLLNDGIDILIATDCLSEGQNLQDADMQINFDIHWNPVRLIQRFGRIDRIGSPNSRISCVNFWPAKSFEEYLHLESRIQDRMSIMNLVGSETQELNDEYQQMVADNPLQDKNADRLLEELTNNSISDIESAQSLSLKDFSFETYRQDLSDFYSSRQDFYAKMPNGVFSGFVNGSEQFADIPESLVALVGYPKKPEGSKSHQYTELYLMCQPVDADPSFQEINKADVLEFLRQNKTQSRSLPSWIADTNEERISRLSNVLKLWNVSQRTINFNGDSNNVTFDEIKSQLPQEKQELVNHAEELYKQLNNSGVDIAKRAQIDIGFFDWRMMFTEVFDVEDGNGGFDIVIGNLPYISAPAQIANKTLSSQRENIIAPKKFSSLYQKWDLYIPFIEHGIQLNCNYGICTMIVPYPLTNQTYGKKLREMIVNDYDLFELCDLNGTKIFENATVSNCIPFIRKAKSSSSTTAISHIDEHKVISSVFNKSVDDLMPDMKASVWNVGEEKRDTNRHVGMHMLGDYCFHFVILV